AFLISKNGRRHMREYHEVGAPNRRSKINPKRDISYDVKSDISQCALEAEKEREEDEEIRQNLLQELSDKKNRKRTRGGVDSCETYGHLRDALPPISDESKGTVQAQFCTPEEAHILTQSTIKVPIIVQDKPIFPWREGTTPIEQFFQDWLPDLKSKISVQNPNHRPKGCSYDIRTWEEVKTRFESNQPHKDSWNVLDVWPFLPNMQPWYLANRNCQFLNQLLQIDLSKKWSQRDVEATKAARWKNMVDGLLLSEGGGISSSHTDGRGFATYIRMLQGMEVFIWQAEVTEEEWDTWATDHSRNNGKVCFVVLRENQTVIFPPGTIHSVARLNKEKTFCATGHFLQWSDLESWLKVLKKQHKDSQTVNEDVGDDSILSLLENAIALIEGRIESRRLEIVGGLERGNNLVDQIKVRLHSNLRIEIAD
ncbi:hypothetical protein FOXB_13258, partial [Fusarium oxysporum f. sp. conglutinans Fo5176]